MSKKSRLQEKIEIRGVSQCISEMDFPNYRELDKILRNVGYRLVEIDDESMEDEFQPRDLKNY